MLRATVSLLTERAGARPVMLPAEVDLLSLDLRNELIAASADTPQTRAQLGRYHALLDGFCRDWRQLYLLYGESEAGAVNMSACARRCATPLARTAKV